MVRQTEGEAIEKKSESAVSDGLPERLREQVSVCRQESAGESMNLLASGQISGGSVSPPINDYSADGDAMAIDASARSRSRTKDDSIEADQPVPPKAPGIKQQSQAQPHVAEADGASAGNEGKTTDVQTCIECEDQHAELVCLACDEPFCRPCWGSLHRQGKRAEHPTQAILGELMPAPTAEAANSASPPSPPVSPVHQSGDRAETTLADAEVNELNSDNEEGAEVEPMEQEEDELSDEDQAACVKHRPKRRCLRGLGVGLDGSSVLEECRFIPLRLNERERGLLAMLKGALNVSEYTDRVDVFSRWHKQRTINEELRFALAALAGMMVAGGPKAGEKLAALQEHLDRNEAAFAEIFEVGRRYKVTNPDKFRTFYGKMMYMLQDAQAARSTSLGLVKEIQMVYTFVEERNGLELLKDKRVLTATADVSGVSMSKTEARYKVTAKVEARAQLLRKYVSDTFPKEDVERALDSIADANNYIAFNVAPVERIIDLLRSNFHPEKPEDEWSLRLVGGRKRTSSASYGYRSFSSYGYGEGYSMSMFGSSTAMLSHDHRTQYTFVMQSLRLWSEAMRNMYRLWYFADSDLLSGKASYRLCNTGQGLNRVQSCPSVSVEMRRILRIVQSECGPWVGLSVVHLGDRDVPNALVFIDKYTQIPRLLNPITEAVRSLEKIALDPVVGSYVDVGWGGVRNAKMTILSNFFKGGFDGSGDDGGSCIDGRLTSAWNWCSLLHKKPFAPIFYLAGQYGFDGGWGNGLEE